MELSDKKVLVKEVCHKTSVLSQFEGVIKTPIPIHEIFEIKHEVRSPRILLGKKVIALLGSILIKAYCVKKEGFEVFLIEKAFDYRSYIPSDYNFHHLKPCASLSYKLEDLIIESAEENEIRLAGIIRTHLTLTVDKEHYLAGLTNHKAAKEESTPEIEKPISHNVLIEKSLASNLDNTAYEASEEEVYAEVIQGHNQDLTIILE